MCFEVSRHSTVTVFSRVAGIKRSWGRGRFIFAEGLWFRVELQCRECVTPVWNSFEANRKKSRFVYIGRVVGELVSRSMKTDPVHGTQGRLWSPRVPIKLMIIILRCFKWSTIVVVINVLFLYKYIMVDWNYRSNYWEYAELLVRSPPFQPSYRPMRAVANQALKSQFLFFFSVNRFRFNYSYFNMYSLNSNTLFSPQLMWFYLLISYFLFLFGEITGTECHRKYGRRR